MYILLLYVLALGETPKNNDIDPCYKKRSVKIRQTILTMIFFNKNMRLPTLCPMPTIIIIDSFNSQILSDRDNFIKILVYVFLSHWVPTLHWFLTAPHLGLLIQSIFGEIKNVPNIDKKSWINFFYMTFWFFS